MMAAMATPDVDLVSTDLLFASRLRAALAGHATVRLVNGSRVLAADTVFMDLNDDADTRIAMIPGLRAQRPGIRIVGFCGHDQRDLRVRAMEHGADQVVTNGALQQAALRLLGATAGG